MKLRVSIGLMVVLLSVACSTPKRATFLESTHDKLAYSKVGYTETLNAFAQAQIDGAINDEQMANIMRIAKGYQGTQNLLVTLLIEYAAASDSTKADIQVRIQGLTGSLDGIMLEFISLLATYGVGVI